MRLKLISSSVAAAVTLLLVIAGFARAQIPMEIVGPGSKLSALAISPLHNLGGDDEHTLSSEFIDTLSRDLKLSGYFRIIDPHSYIEDPQASGYELGKFNFGDWSSLNAEFLVKGAIKVNGSSVELEAYLFDVAQQRQDTGKRFHGDPHDVRRMARRFADAVLESITGRRGPFDSRLAFASTRGGRFKEIYTMSVDGQDLFKVTNNPTINISPSFGGYGRDLLYTSYKSGAPALYLADLIKQRESRVHSGLGELIGGTLTPDGERIVAAVENGGATNLFLLDRSGEMISALTQGRSINVSPSVSADGQKLAFTSDRSGDPQIYVMSLSGGSAKRITYQGNYNTDPSFSPIGDRLAYQSRNHGIFDIYTISLSGGDPVNLTKGAMSSQHPCWSPDGRYIVFSGGREGRAKLYL
ncbi:MAG TPA: DPP IV N-terminal domain-containing protein, partial [Candidatus Binataceae bacterium]|nr:DPP IV N-terminal domain-containing protein [Candidatus Binataceae bacterium]